MSQEPAREGRKIFARDAMAMQPAHLQREQVMVGLFPGLQVGPVYLLRTTSAGITVSRVGRTHTDQTQDFILTTTRYLIGSIYGYHNSSTVNSFAECQFVK